MHRSLAVLLLGCVIRTHGFQIQPQVAPRLSAARACSPLVAPKALKTSRVSLRALSVLGLQSAVSTDSETAATEGLLDRERYVVFNRFTTRDGAGAKFEKRWADRKSSLKVLDGFRFFTLLRRADGVEVNGKQIKYEEATPEYMSMTVWETKKNFNSWRTGYAFKEAHGGGSIGGFLSAMIGSLMVIKTPPVPAMWDALVPISTATSDCVLELKNRDASGKAMTEGKDPLPLECFVAMNRFPVKPESGTEFESRWAQRESKLQGKNGFLGFMLMRRDRPQMGKEGEGDSKKSKGGGAQLPDDKYNYSTCTIWASKQAWEEWREGDGKTIHAAAQQKVESGEQRPVSELLAGSASPIFWEGVLALQSEVGM